ncbi:VOC family protein [Streptomyces sp. NPDC048595]|uniref:VOC family protein n=1 Tax=Streptomyces sp. NPDC048595 TaxID=3365576 RepID=UPI00371A5ADA
MAGATTGAPTMYPTVLYRDAQAAIRQLTEAFGFTVGAKYEGEDGMVLHAELSYGNGVVMLGSKGRGGLFDAAMADAGPAGVYVVVEDTDAHFKRAEQAGVEILMPPTDQDYGSRDYMARDAEGNVWSFGTYAPSGAGA